MVTFKRRRGFESVPEDHESRRTYHWAHSPLKTESDGKAAVGDGDRADQERSATEPRADVHLMTFQTNQSRATAGPPQLENAVQEAKRRFSIKEREEKRSLLPVALN